MVHDPPPSSRILGPPHLARFLSLALCLAAAPSAAGTDVISSAYTPLKLDACKDVTPEDAKEYGTIWICAGHDGIDVRVAEGDLRIFVSYGPKAESQTATYETLPQFNTIGETLEWRIANGKAFATILRFHWDSDNGEGSTLVVTKVAKDDACHVAHIVATGNPKANELARNIADSQVRGFVCKRDKVRTYGPDGKEID